jgi:raffinose/stachyose/melibiose transport system permease protein
MTRYGQEVRRLGWVYVFPALALYAVFMIFPIIYNVVLAFSAHPFYSYFLTLFTDYVFHIAIINSVLWVFVTTLAQMALGFIIAVLLERFVLVGKSVFRTLLFLPMTITPTVIAIVFDAIYAPNYGLIYGVFARLGLASHFPTLLGSPVTATYAIMLVNVWQWVGFYVLLYSVGIANIDKELLDASEIDGAVGWSKVRYIYFPLVRGTHWSLFILGSIQALQQFPLIYLMTEGGPANSTQVLATYIFQKAFIEYNSPYASAISVILLLLAFVVASVPLVITRGDFSIGGRPRNA